MAVYKVIQDIEAEDKLLGWMTLKQFISFCVFGASMYVNVMVLIGNVPFLALIVTVPISIVTGLFAAPLSRVQPTEVWLAARLRFLLKPHTRIWNQSGVQELVTITAPKQIAHTFQNSLSKTEVESRLSALAHTLDSRGWAVKNVNSNLVQNTNLRDNFFSDTDRLVQFTPSQDVPDNYIAASEDIMDTANNLVAQRFDQQIKASTQRVRDDAVNRMQATLEPLETPIESPLDKYSQSQPQDNQAFLNALGNASQAPAYNPTNHMRVIEPVKPITPVYQQTNIAPPILQDNQQPLSSQSVAVDHTTNSAQPQTGTDQSRTTLQITRPSVAAKKVSHGQKPAKQHTEDVTAPPNPAILELAHNNDFSVATIAKQAHRQVSESNEVTIKLR